MLADEDLEFLPKLISSGKAFNSVLLKDFLTKRDSAKYILNGILPSITFL